MTKTIVQDIRYHFNSETRQVEIVDGETVLETTTLANAAARVTFHRNASAAGVVRVDANPYRKHNRKAA